MRWDSSSLRNSRSGAPGIAGVAPARVPTAARSGALAAAALSLVSPAATAEVIVYSASLSGAAESPPVASAGTGTVVVTYDNLAHTLQVEATFSGLTGSVTNAHIHCCTASPFSGTAGVASTTPTFPGFPSGVTSGTYDQTFDLTSASSWNALFITGNGGTPAGAEAALAAGLLAGQAYFNIHTSFAPGGEIRGFLVGPPTQGVPEPGVIALLGVALGGLGLARRARSRA